MKDQVTSETQPAPRIGPEALFRAHARFVAGFVARLGCPPEDVEDAVQEVFLTVHRRGGFEPGVARATTWLAEIAIRVVSTQRRSARRRKATANEDAVALAVAPGVTPHEAAEQRAALQRVDRALASLDVDRRAVFVLFELEGESCEAIATGLGVPVGTVHSRLHAARKAFSQAYTRIERTLPTRTAPLVVAQCETQGGRA
jgi:RNA polymerase sigma-70 factor (ECF subfamily)